MAAMVWCRERAVGNQREMSDATMEKAGGSEVLADGEWQAVKHQLSAGCPVIRQAGQLCVDLAMLWRPER